MRAKPVLQAAKKSAPYRLDEVWARTTVRLRASLGEDVYNSWFGSLQLEDFDAGRVRLSVSTRFLKSWIESHYQAKLIQALDAELEGVVLLEISARSSQTSVTNAEVERIPTRLADEAGETHGPQKRGSVATGRSALASPLDRRLTFSTFVSGRANQLALSLARKVSESNDATMSPLYIHAGVGLGKTHLLQAIAHAALARKQSVVYVTAEAFMFGFVNALRSQSAISFKEQLRSTEILIFDDAQFLQGRVIQNEFGHVLNSLIDAGRQVVIAADRPPSELDAVDERVRSRLAGGICVEMQSFDETMRLKILEERLTAAKLAFPALQAPPEVVAFIAGAVAPNGRDLEGAVNRLVAHAQLTATPITLALAELAVRDLVRNREPKRVKIEDIQKRVAIHYNVSRADLLSSRRTAAVVMPRQIAMFLAKSLTLRSLPEIGRRFGGRDHTTVLHAVRKIDKLCNTNSALKDELELLKRTLQE
jgi:chromosomal replication initiator protein